MGIQAAEISAILKDQIKNFGQDAEVAEVGVERLGPGHREEHRAQHDQRGERRDRHQPVQPVQHAAHQDLRHRRS